MWRRRKCDRQRRRRTEVANFFVRSHEIRCSNKINCVMHTQTTSHAQHRLTGHSQRCERKCVRMWQLFRPAFAFPVDESAFAWFLARFYVPHRIGVKSELRAKVIEPLRSKRRRGQPDERRLQYSPSSMPLLLPLQIIPIQIGCVLNESNIIWSKWPIAKDTLFLNVVHTIV